MFKRDCAIWIDFRHYEHGWFVCLRVRVCGVRASMMHALCALHPQGAIDARINGRALMQCTIYLRFSDKRRSVMRGAVLPWATCSQYAANMPLCRWMCSTRCVWCTNQVTNVFFLFIHWKSVWSLNALHVNHKWDNFVCMKSSSLHSTTHVFGWEPKI